MSLTASLTPLTMPQEARQGNGSASCGQNLVKCALLFELVLVYHSVTS